MNHLQAPLLRIFVICLSLTRTETGFVQHKGTFWQITDIHLDPFYSETGNIQKECHGNSSTASIGHYGNFKCDAPWSLVKDAIHAIKAVEPNPDFILWTGDSTAHIRSMELNWERVYANLENITDLLLEAFPSSLIIPVIGNHDSYPANDFPYDNVKSMYQGYLSKAKWGQLIPPEEVRTFHQGGYYGRFVGPRLKILVLNTNLYLLYNVNRTEEEDPTGQLAWLEGELKIAKENSIAVIITAHVPPGYFERVAIIPFLATKFNDGLVNLLLNYSSVILTQIYGHTHTDSFRLISEEDPEASPKLHAFIAPSVSPWKVPNTGMNGVNPAVRLYNYSLERNIILDYSQYFLNLTKANAAMQGLSEPELETPASSTEKGKSQEFTEMDETNETEEMFSFPEGELAGVGYDNSSAKWEFLYRASEFYGVTNLNLTSLETIYSKITHDPEVFQQYYEMNTVGLTAEPCGHACYVTHICAMRYITTSTISRCLRQLLKDPVDSDAAHGEKHTHVGGSKVTGSSASTSETTEDAHKHHHRHITPYMSHVIIGIAAGLVITLIVVGVLAIRRWRFRSYFRYKRHFSVQS